MKHALSDAEKARRSRPFSHTGRFWGAAAVACVVAPYLLWQMGGSAVLGLTPYLVAAAVVGCVVVFVRRRLRPPLHMLDETFIEVTPGGIWQVSPGVRTLLVAGPQVQQVRVTRSDFPKGIARIVLASGGEGVTITGLRDMRAFLDDVLATFERSQVVEDVVEPSARSRGSAQDAGGVAGVAGLGGCDAGSAGGGDGGGGGC